MQRLHPDETSDAPPEGVLPEKGGPERGGPSLREVFAATATDGGVTGFVLAHLAPGETVLWAQDHQSRREAGRPSIAGLTWMLGGMPDLLLLDVNQPRDVLWVMEQALGCPAIKTVVGEVWGDPRVLDFTATKRLAMRSEESGVAAWLVRRGATADLSAARERWRIASLPSPPQPDDPHAPGAPLWQASLFRTRFDTPGEWVARHGRGAGLELLQGQPGAIQPAESEKAPLRRLG